MVDSKFVEDFKSAIRAGVPLVVARTMDPAAVIEQVRQITLVKGGTRFNAPIIRWDVSSGLSGVNEEGAVAVDAIIASIPANQTKPLPQQCTDPGMVMRLLKTAPTKSIVFMLNGHRFIGEKDIPQAVVGQGIWNLRDAFKKDKRILILLSPDIQLPAELSQDVLVLDDPLPTPEELSQLVHSLYQAGNSQDKSFPEKPTPEMASKAVEAVRGLSTFAAEQVIAMSLQRTGINLEKLWKRKKTQIEQTKGVGIWKGKETYEDVRGVLVIKEFITALFNGEDKPTVIVFSDEIEKQLAGTSGDLSGISQEMHGQMLSWMADEEIMALLMVGHPGCTKSFLAKATGGQFGYPTIMLNLSDLKGSLVGQSTQQLRGALKMISAIGRPLFMATCNAVDTLSPELRSRFELGTFFFDLPNSQERKAVWELYIKKYSLPETAITFNDKDWTPREIHACCKLARRLKWSLEKASKFVVPVITSAPDRIEALRGQADGRFLSASTAGIYHRRRLEQTPEVSRSLETLNEIGEA